MLMCHDGMFESLLVKVAILCLSAGGEGCTYYLPCVNWVVGMVTCLGQFPSTFACATLDLCSPRAHAARVARPATDHVLARS